MADNSTIKGRAYTTEHIKSFIHKSRYSFLYRRYKPDHARNTEDDYAYPVINAVDHDDVNDQAVTAKDYQGHFNERVDDHPEQWELIGQIPAAFSRVVREIRTEKEMQVQVLRGHMTVPYSYLISTDDHIIELTEGVAVANRVEWKVLSVHCMGEQYWSCEVLGLVGVHG